MPEQARAAGRSTVELGGNVGYGRFGYGRSSSTGMTATLPDWTGGRVRSAVRAASGDVAADAERLLQQRARSCEMRMRPRLT